MERQKDDHVDEYRPSIQYEQPTLGQSMKTYFVLGVGVSLGFALVRLVLG